MRAAATAALGFWQSRNRSSVVTAPVPGKEGVRVSGSNPYGVRHPDVREVALGDKLVDGGRGDAQPGRPPGDIDGPVSRLGQPTSFLPGAPLLAPGPSRNGSPLGAHSVGAEPSTVPAGDLVPGQPGGRAAQPHQEFGTTNRQAMSAAFQGVAPHLPYPLQPFHAWTAGRVAVAPWTSTLLQVSQWGSAARPG